MSSQPPSGVDAKDVDDVVDSILADNAAVEAKRRQANVVYGPDTLADMVKQYAVVGWCAGNSVAIGQCLYDGCIATTEHIINATDEDIETIFADADFAIEKKHMRQVVKALRQHSTVTDYMLTTGLRSHLQDAARRARALGRSVSQRELLDMASQARGQAMGMSMPQTLDDSVDRRVGRSQSVFREEQDEEIHIAATLTLSIDLQWARYSTMQLRHSGTLLTLLRCWHSRVRPRRRVMPSCYDK